MRELLIAEMKRAIELMERNPEIDQPHQYSKDQAELKQINHMVRKHSIELEQIMYPKYGGY